MDIIQKSDFYDDIFNTSQILLKSLKVTCDTAINKKICILSFSGNDILNLVNVSYLLGLHLTILDTNIKLVELNDFLIKLKINIIFIHEKIYKKYAETLNLSPFLKFVIVIGKLIKYISSKKNILTYSDLFKTSNYIRDDSLTDVSHNFKFIEITNNQVYTFTYSELKNLVNFYNFNLKIPSGNRILIIGKEVNLLVIVLQIYFISFNIIFRSVEKNLCYDKNTFYVISRNYNTIICHSSLLKSFYHKNISNYNIQRIIFYGGNLYQRELDNLIINPRKNTQIIKLDGTTRYMKANIIINYLTKKIINVFPELNFNKLDIKSNYTIGLLSYKDNNPDDIIIEKKNKNYIFIGDKERVNLTDNGELIKLDYIEDIISRICFVLGVNIYFDSQRTRASVKIILKKKYLRNLAYKLSINYLHINDLLTNKRIILYIYNDILSYCITNNLEIECVPDIDSLSFI